LSFGRFCVLAVGVAVKIFFYKFISIYGLFIKFCQKIQNGGSRHLGLLFGNAGPPTKYPW